MHDIEAELNACTMSIRVDADYAYTVDGGPVGELEFENFNAASARLTVWGRSTHTGDAKGKMKNAIL